MDRVEDESIQDIESDRRVKLCVTEQSVFKRFKRRWHRMPSHLVDRYQKCGGKMSDSERVKYERRNMRN